MSSLRIVVRKKPCKYCNSSKVYASGKNLKEKICYTCNEVQ